MARRVLSVAVSTVAAMSLSASSNVRAITITEEAGSSYNLCTDLQVAPFSNAVLTESTECAAKVTYNWSTDFLPTTAQRNELCTCKALMSKLQTVKIPHCGFYRINPQTFAVGYYSYKDFIKYGFDLCSTSSSTTTTTTTTTTTRPPTLATTRPPATATPTRAPSVVDSVPTYSPYTYTPYTYVPVATYPPYTYSPSFDFDASTSSSKKKSKSTTGTIVGISIAFVVVAAIVAFVVRKRKQKRPEEALGKRHSLSSDAGSDLEAGAVGTQAAGDLSPLGGGDYGEYASYTNMPPSPSAPDAKHIAL